MHRLDPELHARLCASAAGDETASYRDAAILAPKLIPIYLDWVGFFGLSVEGEILFIPWDPPHDAEPVREQSMVRVALAAAGEHYPELSVLRPERPPSGITCAFCGGTGRPRRVGGPAPGNIRCFYGGLGWLLPGEAEQASRP